MINNGKTYLFFISLSFILNACKSTIDKKRLFHFTQMDGNETNIRFNNEIIESDSVNVYMNEYMYNGSGVGIGDFNNDGLADIFFGGSMVSSKLYINKGEFKFEDITADAGLQTSNGVPVCLSLILIMMVSWIFTSALHIRLTAKKEKICYLLMMAIFILLNRQLNMVLQIQDIRRRRSFSIMTRMMTWICTCSITDCIITMPIILRSKTPVAIHPRRTGCIEMMAFCRQGKSRFPGRFNSGRNKGGWIWAGNSCHRCE